MSIEYRTVAPDEHESAMDAISTGFLERPDVGRIAEVVRTQWEPGRLWAAFDGDRVCGTFRSWSTEVTVPGLARLPAAAVSAVTVLPTHRRRGILTGLAAREHAALRERGDAMAILYASEYPIYGRFGYAPATRWASWTVDTRLARMHHEPAGSVELVTPSVEAGEQIRGIHEAFRVAQAGDIRRSPFTWAFRLGIEDEPWGERWKGFLVVHRDPAGVADGFARYSAKGDWTDHIPQSKVEVQELVAATNDAYAGLWRYLLDLDLVGTVTVEATRERERLPWLLANARAARPKEPGDGIWVRLFDLRRALAARTYEREDSLVLEVVDDAAWGGTQRLLLDAGPDGATCTPTDRSPDLTLPVAALGGAYLGGTRLRDLVLATGADEHRPGALAGADALFRTADAPWCSTFF